MPCILPSAAQKHPRGTRHQQLLSPRSAAQGQDAKDMGTLWKTAHQPCMGTVFEWGFFLGLYHQILMVWHRSEYCLLAHHLLSAIARYENIQIFITT